MTPDNIHESGKERSRTVIWWESSPTRTKFIYWFIGTVWLLPFVAFRWLCKSSKNLLSRKWWRSSPRRVLVKQWAIGLITMTFLGGVSSYWGANYRFTFPRDVLDWPLDLAIVGVVLPVLTGGLTLGGFLWTLRQLEVLQNRITSFEDFLSKTNEIIREAQVKGQRVSIMCHSPAIGNLSAFNTEEFREFQGYLRDGMHDINLLCLDLDDLKKFYGSYRKRFREPDLVNERLKQAEVLYGLDSGPESKEVGLHFYRQKYERLPDFYLVFSMKKAIVASVFFLPPFLLSEIADGVTTAQVVTPSASVSNPTESYPFKNRLRPDRSHVEIYGYITTERLEIDRCREAFQYYATDQA